MTDRDFDKFAVDAINRRRERRATWEAFCNRNDLTDHSYSRERDKARWSPRTFKYALQRMPKDHPDRWKYLVGARYAPWTNANGTEEAWWMAWGMFNLVVGAVGLPLLLAGLSHGVPAILLIFPGALAVYWLYWLLDRYRKLSL